MVISVLLRPGRVLPVGLAIRVAHGGRAAVIAPEDRLEFVGVVTVRPLRMITLAVAPRTVRPQLAMPCFPPELQLNRFSRRLDPPGACLARVRRGTDVGVVVPTALPMARDRNRAFGDGGHGRRLPSGSSAMFWAACSRSLDGMRIFAP